MAPIKTRAYVLRVLPYRESSIIGYLFTESHGLVHGLARGIRRPAKGAATPLERGFLVETFLYMRPNRDLHTLGGTALLEAFPKIRASLLKTTVRDMAFEVALSGIQTSDPHPELFGFFARFLNYLDSCSESCAHPFALWRFLHRFPALLGFGLDPGRCMACGAELTGGGELDVASGGLRCEECAVKWETSRYVPCAAQEVLAGRRRDIREIRRVMGDDNVRRITRLLADFCRYHFESRGEYRSLQFLEGLTV